MNAESVQGGTQIDQAEAVEAQTYNGCPSDSGDADDLRRIVTPPEMIHPLVLSWVE